MCLPLFTQNRKNWFKACWITWGHPGVLFLGFHPSVRWSLGSARAAGEGVHLRRAVRCRRPQPQAEPGSKGMKFLLQGKSFNYATFLCLPSIMKWISKNSFCMWKLPILSLPGLTLPPVSPELSLKHLVHSLTWSKISSMLLSVCLLLTWTGKNMLPNVILSL